MSGRGRLRTARSWRTARRFCVVIAVAALFRGVLAAAASPPQSSQRSPKPFPTQGTVIRALQNLQVVHPVPVLIELFEPGFTFNSFSHDCTGGMDFLPDGDIVCLDGAMRLYTFDANFNGAPTDEQLIAQVGPGGVFGAFVRVSPNGQTALVAESSFGRVYRVDLGAQAVQKLTTIAQPFAAVFASDTHAIISANPTGSGTTLYACDLTTGALLVIGQLSGPSGPLVLDAAGHLYYVRSTFDFPAPPDSHALLQFSAEEVAEALAGTRVLTEVDADVVATLDSGFALTHNESGDSFATNLFGVVYHVHPDGSVTDFAQAAGGGFALFSYAAMSHPNKPFQPYARTSPARLAFFVDDLAGHRQVIVVRPAGATPSHAPPAPPKVEARRAGGPSGLRRGVGP